MIQVEKDQPVEKSDSDNLIFCAKGQKKPKQQPQQNNSQKNKKKKAK